METLLKMILSQLSQAYYFTTCILVLKFMNKGIFFEEIQDLHFPQKRGYFGTHLCKFGERVYFWCPVFYHEKGDSFGLKSHCLTQKRGSFWTEKSVFYREKGVVLSWKVSVLKQKRGAFSNWRTRMGTIFFQWLREPGILYCCHYLVTHHKPNYWTKTLRRVQLCITYKARVMTPAPSLNWKSIYIYVNSFYYWC